MFALYSLTIRRAPTLLKILLIQEVFLVCYRDYFRTVLETYFQIK